MRHHHEHLQERFGEPERRRMLNIVGNAQWRRGVAARGASQ
jgi:hypothetical protein